LRGLSQQWSWQRPVDEPVRLSIIHTTTYRFARDVQFHPHRLMLRPRGSHDLHVLEHVLHCSPAAQLDWSQDVFGNLVCTAAFDQPAAELAISSHLVVATSAEAWPVFRIAPSAHAYPFEYSPEELIDLGALRRPEHASSPVEAWARGFVWRAPTDTLSLLKDLNAGVLGAAVYRPRDEEGTQSAAATLDMASGSCRDLAALFIDAARHLGFGARAVSGYLFDPAAADLQSDTTHAWAEVYLPGAGWIAFDPTHGRVGSGGLITVAIGRCNAQVMPVVGSYVGQPQDFLGMTVAVGAKGDPAAF
jgi:transglutaminase-like putative cysteine protease